jgi:hypothetical protein
MTLRSSIKLDGRASQSYAELLDAVRFGGGGPFPNWSLILQDGTGPNQANKLFVRDYTLTAGTSQTLDLTALTRVYLPTVSFTAVKWLFIRLRSPETLIKAVVGNAASNVWSAFLSASTATIDVKDKLEWSDPIDGGTVDGTHKNVKINNLGGTTIIVDVVLIGI